jgi:iron complex outermembrane receptor protein
MFNARVTWDAPVGDWSVAFAVTNLADEEYFVNKFTLLPFGLGTLEGQPGRPQEWAIIVRKTF